MAPSQVIIVPYDAAWPSMFEAECLVIGGAIRSYIIGEIEHIGSTLTTRAGYAALKHELAERYRDDREAYTENKTDFIHRPDK